MPTTLEAKENFLFRYEGQTRCYYKRDIEYFLDYCGDRNEYPLNYKTIDIEKYLKHIKSFGWADSTVHRKFLVVALFYKYAIIDDFIVKDPTLGVKRPGVDKSKQKRTFMTPLEFGSFLEAAKEYSPNAHALTALMGLSGLRVSEACGIQIENLTMQKGYDVALIKGKNNTEIIVPFPVPVMRAVREVQGSKITGPLLINNYGNPMNRSNATLLLQKVAKIANIKYHISPHSLRRTFCTSGLVSGVPIRDMQLAMRHASISTTAIYDVAAGSLDRHASHRIAAFLAGTQDWR